MITVSPSVSRRSPSSFGSKLYRTLATRQGMLPVSFSAEPSCSLAAPAPSLVSSTPEPPAAAAAAFSPSYCLTTAHPRRTLCWIRRRCARVVSDGRSRFPSVSFRDSLWSIGFNLPLDFVVVFASSPSEPRTSTSSSSTFSDRLWEFARSTSMFDIDPDFRSVRKSVSGCCSFLKMSCTPVCFSKSFSSSRDASSTLLKLR
mmetsp:Transcript_9693/g.23844  ORF Transcript_9693/g.23844 Transcript_9693/m.23844 type:complete len:201 (+) Transcript_9693:837-1439(+)